MDAMTARRIECEAEKMILDIDRAVSSLDDVSFKGFSGESLEDLLLASAALVVAAKYLKRLDMPKEKIRDFGTISLRGFLDNEFAPKHTGRKLRLVRGEKKSK